MAQISIINIKDIIQSKRFDAEYFKPEYLEIERKIYKYSYKEFREYIDFLTDYTSNGSFASLKENVKLYNEKKYAKWIRINELYNMDFSKCRYVDEKGYNFLKKTKLFGDELLISKTGEYLGTAFIMPKINFKATLADNIFLIRLKKDISKIFIQTYINSKIGQAYIKRLSQGVGQPTILKESLRKIKIPLFPQSFQLQIEKIVKEAYQKQSLSKQLYKDAEQILLEELDLVDFKPKHKLTFITTKKDIKETKRFDAEYFQPKYEEIIEKIKSYKGGWDYVGNVVNIKDKNFIPKKYKKYKYVALADISNHGYISSFTEDFGENLPTRARRKINKGDVIVSSIEGSLNSCALVDEEFHDAICSTGFYVMNSERINSETLLILIKSFIIQKLMKRGCKGTILTAIPKDELEKIIIPLISPQTQTQIAKKIEESFKLRKESKELLEKAKRMVEEEIENV